MPARLGQRGGAVAAEARGGRPVQRVGERRQRLVLERPGDQGDAGRNSRLGRYTNFANLLDCAAIAVPAGFRPDGLPAGVTPV
jgi:Asp-tRNA(Asn)/Glu-tRNA(Gln) amidotransferase A subunit family amidase